MGIVHTSKGILAWSDTQMVCPWWCLCRWRCPWTTCHGHDHGRVGNPRCAIASRIPANWIRCSGPFQRAELRHLPVQVGHHHIVQHQQPHQQPSQSPRLRHRQRQHNHQLWQRPHWQSQQQHPQYQPQSQRCQPAATIAPPGSPAAATELRWWRASPLESSHHTRSYWVCGCWGTINCGGRPGGLGIPAGRSQYTCHYIWWHTLILRTRHCRRTTANYW